MLFEEFQDGYHWGQLWYRNRTILTTLNLYVTPMPPNKFQLNPTYGLGGDAVWKNFKMATMAAFFDIGTERF